MVQDKAAVGIDKDEVFIVHARVSLSKFLSSSVEPAVMQKLSQEVNESLKIWSGHVKQFEDYGYIRQCCDKIREVPDGQLSTMVSLFAEQDRKVQEAQHVDLDLMAAITEFRQAFAITDQARQSCMTVKIALKDVMLEALKVFVLREDQSGKKTRTANAMKKSFSPLVTQMGQLLAFSLTPKDDSTNLELVKALFYICTKREQYETIVDVCIGADTLQKAAEAIESNGVVFKKTSTAIKKLMPMDFFKDRISWLLPSSEVNHETVFIFVEDMHSKFVEAKKQVEQVCGKAMMAPKANLEKPLSALATDSPQAVANKVNIDKQHLTDSCVSVKSQLEAFGDTDVVVGQEKPELQSIVVSCDELRASILHQVCLYTFHSGLDFDFCRSRPACCELRLS